LWQAFSSPYGNTTLWAVGLLVAGMTAFYMFRQVFMVFFGEFRGGHEAEHHLHESPSSMTTPLWMLMVGSVLAGFLWIPHVWLPFETWLEPVMVHPVAAEATGAGVGMELLLMLVSVVVALSGIGFAYQMYY